MSPRAQADRPALPDPALPSPPPCADASPRRAPQGASGKGGTIRLVEVAKSYGPTRACAGVSLDFRPGEILGLVGANGAGKSTLMGILCGVVEPDAGGIEIDGAPSGLRAHDVRAARARGIRIVFQESSLCTNLSVAENFLIELPGLAGRGPGWRARCRDLARRALDDVFPGMGIDPGAPVADLSIGQRQMVEIARAVAAPGLRLLVLDEPTSSLDAEGAAALRRHLRRRAEEGVSFVYISHKLREVADLTSRVAVLRNGGLVWEGPTGTTTVEAMVERMGGETRARQGMREAEGARAASPAPRGAVPLVEIGGGIRLHAGEVVGFAGLEGSGQREMLHRILAAGPDGPAGGVRRGGTAAFVSGDRQREGVFPLWDVLSNVAIGPIARLGALGLVSRRRLAAGIEPIARRLSLDPARLYSPILDLSGGNQQKALVARALASDPGVVLLDDPTRGVDTAAKQAFYRAVRSMAGEGRLVLWHSTEDAEFLECDRVLVFGGGAIRGELAGEGISEEAILALSFERRSDAENAGQGPGRDAGGPASAGRRGRLAASIPFLALGAVFSVLAGLNPNVATAFGLELLLGSAVALVLVALAQTFVVGGGEIDLGVGAFAGLVSVIAAVWLAEAPALGSAALAAAFLAYVGMGPLIERRGIPAIVVTLGASFVWAGVGYTLQPTPGGTSPAWLSAAFATPVLGIPNPVLVILAAALAAWALDRSRPGVVLRGFGDNPGSVARCGWSPTRYAALRYLVAGCFATAAGLSLTAINAASDINAGGSFTLLGVAAVVMGGCALTGGRVRPLGVACAAVTLSLVGSLLGTLRVGTDYGAAVQGGLLIAILGLRSVLGGREDEA